LIPLNEIRAARERIADVAMRTPLVRIDGTDIWLKLENLQPIGSFKIRGAYNAIVQRDGLNAVGTASAGNMAQGVAWAARELGLTATIVVPDHAPQTKIDAIERLGGTVVKVPYEEWWGAIEQGRHDAVRGLFVHPVQSDAVMAGNGTIGLEIYEDLPEVETVLVPYGGGGLVSGIASALKQLKPGLRALAVEPETGAPLAASLAAGEPQDVDYTPSFVDGAGARAVLPGMWELVQEVVDAAVTVSIDEAAEAVRFLAERVRVVAEGAGALALAAARRGTDGPTVCVVSGGNIDAARLAQILGGTTPS
jgi:threonine dehydratase